MDLSVLEQKLAASRSKKWNYTPKIGEVFKGETYRTLTYLKQKIVLFKFKDYFAIVYDAQTAEEDVDFSKFLNEQYIKLTDHEKVILNCPLDKTKNNKDSVQEFFEFMSNNKNN